MDSPLLFFSLFPIITAALRFSFLTSLAVALFIAIGYLSLGFLSPTPFTVGALLTKIGNVVIILLAAVVTGLIGGQMKRRVALIRRQEEEEELRRLRARQQQSRLIFELASTLSRDAELPAGSGSHPGRGGDRPARTGGTGGPSGGPDPALPGRPVEGRGVSPYPRRDQQMALEGTVGVLAQALRTAEPGSLPGPGEDPELGRFVSLHQCREAVAVPLRAGFETFGLAVFGSPQTGLFTPDYQDLLSALCNQGVVALQNARSIRA